MPEPPAAGELMVRYAEGRVMEYREAEVMDIDENLFRQASATPGCTDT